MGATSDGSVRDLLNAVTGAKTPRTTFFDLNAADFTPVIVGANGEGGGNFPQSIVDNVDLREYHRGLEVQATDCGALNILHIRFAPGYTIPRHHHNTDQLVLVLEGEAIQGNRRFGPGEGYFTPAGNTYTVTAGSGGLRLIEIRTTPLAELTTDWDEDDPARWKHATV